MGFSYGRPTGGLRAVSLAGALMLATTLAGPAFAADTCPRLPSASLVIVIPEGGCGDAEAASSVLSAASEVTVIRGGGLPASVRKSRREAVVEVSRRAGSRTVVIVVDKRL